MTPRRWRRVRLSRRAVIGLSVLAFLGAIVDVGVAWRAERIVDQLVRNRVAGAIADKTGGVYVLELSPSSVNWLLRRVTVDSVSLTTRRALNTSRPAPLLGLNIALNHCTISGVHLFTLIRGGGLVAGSLACRSGDLLVEFPHRPSVGGPGAGTPASDGSTFETSQSLLALQRSVRLPPYVPRVRLARVLFPRLAVHLRLIRASGRPTPLELEQLESSLSDLVIDPADTAAASRLLFSRMIELVATNLAAYQHGGTAVRVSRLHASLTDSTLEAHGIAYGPTGSGAAFMRSSRFGRDLVRLAAGHFAAAGVDFGAFLLGGGVRARRVDVDSLRIGVTSDKAVPKNSRDTYGTPQQWIAALDQSVSVDSLRVRGGAVVYREHAAGRDGVGVITFARIEAAAAGVRHLVGRRTSDDPMTLVARAQFQNAGQFDVRFVVPLDAPRFDMGIRGTLGPMPVQALNSFVLMTHALKVGNGQVAGIAFDMGVRNGVATGTITPRYSDLSVTVTRSGSGGILGSGGFLGGAARGIANIVAGSKVRADNPERDADAPHVGVIRHAFVSDETLIAFLWSSLRDGLFMVVKK